MTSIKRFTPLLFGLATLAGPALAQPAGFTPPEDVFVEASLTEGGIALSTQAVTLTRGDYYRLNLACVASEAGEPEFNFDAGRLARDSHLRVLTVDTIEVYLQGLSFRALQCEGVGTVKFSFYPMRAGEYVIEVTDEADEDVTASFTVTVE
ncbi:MAG: hypothetical protein NXH97_09490 [Rhodobacteraceae bacterium]|nr:hypothetical protein [Paracoccaceae bacterium]